MRKNKKDSVREDVIICRCEEVKKSEILQAIRSGARTINGIKKRTRAGMGLCKGSTCEHLIRRILAQAIKCSPGELKPSTVRPPLRAIKLKVLKGEG